MKTMVFILMAIPFAVFGQWGPYGILKAEVNGNSVILRNDSIYRNCLCNYLMEVTQLNGDTLAWYQLEQSENIAYCICHFNLSVTLDSLEAGNYYVKTYFTDIPYPTGDTNYIGLISFTIAEQNSFNNYSFGNGYQSLCFNIYTGTEEQPINHDLSVFPVPAGDQITVTIPDRQGESHLKIFNVSGEKVLERQLTNTENQIDISTLPRGIYFVKVQNDKIMEVGKIIKE